MSIRINRVICALLMVGVTSIATADDQVYVESENSNFGLHPNFGLLDMQTGAYTLIGVVSESLASGMGFASNGSLYGLGLDSVLYRINTGTGSLAAIGNTGVSQVGGAGMGATNDGTLYLVAGGNEFYTISATNAQSTFIGTTGFSTGTCPAGDSAGNLYDQETTGDGFYKINRTTGQGTLLGYSNDGLVETLVYTNNTMYAINASGGIYTINLTNGASTLLSTYNTNTVGVVYAAAASSSVPEASTLAIGSLAGITAGIGWLRRRRNQV